MIKGIHTKPKEKSKVVLRSLHLLAEAAISADQSTQPRPSNNLSAEAPFFIDPSPTALPSVTNPLTGSGDGSSTGQRTRASSIGLSMAIDSDQRLRLTTLTEIC
ncbi:Uncharacterized protein TCM_015641 [Theobroma cacao]|uniref:Uncharacterized protein n=1 Tax=Theobroma cacao TaxID=3641 RepID=A0A061G2S6_THECC|nr:Uncharacterized protein TCM_015641 [Theobroma cacao]